MVKLRKEFSAADPTALTRAKLLPQLCASKDCPLPRNSKVKCPARAISAATDVRDRIVVAPQCKISCEGGSGPRVLVLKLHLMRSPN